MLSYQSGLPQGSYMLPWSVSALTLWMNSSDYRSHNPFSRSKASECMSCNVWTRDRNLGTRTWRAPPYMHNTDKNNLKGSVSSNYSKFTMVKRKREFPARKQRRKVAPNVFNKALDHWRRCEEGMVWRALWLPFDRWTYLLNLIKAQCS